MESEGKVLIQTYDRVWHVEKKIYAIQNLKLPVPVNPYQVGYFMGTAFIILAIGKVFAPMLIIPVVVRFVAIPYLLSNYLMKKKLDGKKPIKFFVDYILYLILEKGCFLERFQIHSARKVQMNMSWQCSRAQETKKRRKKQHVPMPD